MKQYKHHILIHRKSNTSKIDKCWYQRKGISQSSNYGSYLSPKIYTLYSCLDKDEDNLIFLILLIIMKRNCGIYLMRIWLILINQMTLREKVTSPQRFCVLRLYHINHLYQYVMNYTLT